MYIDVDFSREGDWAQLDMSDMINRLVSKDGKQVGHIYNVTERQDGTGGTIHCVITDKDTIEQLESNESAPLFDYIGLGEVVNEPTNYDGNNDNDTSEKPEYKLGDRSVDDVYFRRSGEIVHEKQRTLF